VKTISSRSLSLALLLVPVVVCRAEGPGTKADIEKKLTEQYALTKTTDDKTDIVTAGSVLVLQKDKIVMVTADSAANQCPNTYKDGALHQGGACRANETLKKIPLFGHTIPGQDKVPNTRAFVTGEKFWVTKIEMKDSTKNPELVMEFFSDAINDVRYKGILTIPFKKGALPSPDEALKTVAEVVTVAPSEDAKQGGDQGGQQQGGQQQGGQQQGGQPAPQEQAPPQQAEPAPPAEPAEAPPAAIEPPPPPPAEPATVSVGQTPDEVIAALGQPAKKAKVGTKEIYYYKDLKVVFVNGKVKDVQ